MPTNEERREIAARLAMEAQAWRETFPDNECDFSDAAAIMQDLCVFIGLERNALCSEVFKRLAELIEPERTCRIVPHGHLITLSDGTELHESACSECGAYLGDEDNYCSICGAKVVE